MCLSCVFLSVHLFLCSKSVKHCAVICYLYTAMIHSPRFPDSEQGILSAQVSCQERSTWGQETLITPNLKQYLQAGGQMQPSTTQKLESYQGDSMMLLAWRFIWVCSTQTLIPAWISMGAILDNKGGRHDFLLLHLLPSFLYNSLQACIQCSHASNVLLLSDSYTGMHRLAARYSRAYVGVNILPSPMPCLSPFFPSHCHLHTSQSGNQIIPWTRHAESMATALCASLWSLFI